ncbi:MAG: 2-C-methyl-D-erythritol 4-phosphate cytidylyltransferase [Streptosporangiales bacterium]|nr:2-C-methyl-D-erythritol 4-phosphate cytidylyltransferase [Streptosporangiales bacterium]
MTVAAIVPAAGRGERMGPGGPKALRPIAGTPMLVYAVRSLASARSVDLVLVAAPPDDVHAVSALLVDHELAAEVDVIAGGTTRQESVRLALASLPADADIVLVHDAARPLAPAELADDVVRAIRGGAEAVVPGAPVADTIKHIDVAGQVVRTIDRGMLRAAQTPQGFRRDVLTLAHDAASASTAQATDDAGLVELSGHPVVVIPGAEEAFKVTRPLDLVVAEAVLASQRSTHGR